MSELILPNAAENVIMIVRSFPTIKSVALTTRLGANVGKSFKAFCISDAADDPVYKMTLNMFKKFLKINNNLKNYISNQRKNSFQKYLKIR